MIVSHVNNCLSDIRIILKRHNSYDTDGKNWSSFDEDELEQQITKRFEQRFEYLFSIKPTKIVKDIYMKYTDLISKFFEIAERKVSVIDDY